MDCIKTFYALGRFKHKVFDGLAKRGKSSMGWFYGFKIHLITDEFGHLLAIKITTGEVNERRPLSQLLNSLKGTVVADAAYLSKELHATLWEKSIHLFTGVRKKFPECACLFSLTSSLTKNKLSVISLLIGYSRYLLFILQLTSFHNA